MPKQTIKTYCKNCEYYDRDCELLVQNQIELPCGKYIPNPELIKEVKKHKVKIYERTCLNGHIGMFYSLDNVINSCTLNKGNCKFYKKKWYKFWIKE